MSKKNTFLLFLATSIALMIVALYNGFPLVERTTGRYIEQAFSHGNLPPDDTPFYGLFLRITGLCTSLWFTLFAQCMVLAFLLLRYIAMINDGRKEIRYILISVITIVSFTSVGWVTAYILPVVFGATLLLSVLLFLSDHATAGRSWLYALFIFVSLTQHISFFLVILFFGAILLITSLIRQRRVMVVRSLVLIILAVCFWSLMSAINYKKGNGFTYLRGKQVLLMARLSEDGILDAYFNEDKKGSAYRLSAYKEHLPVDGETFLWSDESPLFLMGGWDSCRDEYSRMIHEVFANPKYIYMYTHRSVTNTFRQLVYMQAPEYVVNRKKGTETYARVQAHFADEIPEYTTSLQNNDNIFTDLCNVIYNFTLLISGIWLFFLGSAVFNQRVRTTYLYILLFLIVNALVSALFFTGGYKYQYNIFWVLPATNIIVLLNYYFKIPEQNPSIPAEPEPNRS